MTLYRMNTYCNRVPMFTFPIKVDLGAGKYPLPGFVRIDFDPGAAGTDISWDITNGIPLPNDSVSELYTSHFLEHLVPTDVHYVLQEIFRIAMPGGKVTIKLPHGNTPEGHLPCHYSRFTEESMQAIHNWFPHEGHPDYNGNYFDAKKIWRDGIHLIAEYVIVKGKPL